MQAPLRVRFWLEASLASTCGLLTVITVSWRGWVEALTGLNPDHQNGTLEWAIVVVLASAAIIVGLAARTERRRPRTAVSTL
jgi:hypothetical protein